MTYTCAITLDASEGKHYVLKTTEGEELVSPRALLGAREPSALYRARITKLEGRIERLEKLLVERDQEHVQEDDAAEPAEPSPAKKTAAPAKKAPAQRKAVD